MAAELAHDSGHTAHIVEVLDVQGPRRRDAHDVGRFLADIGPVGHRDRATGLMGDRREVEHRVGGTAKGHVDHHAVLDRVLVDQIEGRDVVLKQLHDLHAGMLGQTDALGVHGRDRAVAGQGDAEHFGKAADGVGREHARAAAARGAGGVFVPGAFLFGHLAGGYRTHGVEEGVEVGFLAVMAAAGEHGAARDNNGGDVEAAGRHQHAGNHLVAAGDEDHGVELMALHRALDAVGNDLAARETVAHAGMVHRDAVADADRGHLGRRAAAHADARLDGIGDVLQVHVAGDDVGLRAHYRDKRLSELLVGEAVGLEQAAVRGACQSLLDRIASHVTPSRALWAHIKKAWSSSPQASHFNSTERHAFLQPYRWSPVRLTRIPLRAKIVRAYGGFHQTAPRWLSERPSAGSQRPPALYWEGWPLLSSSTHLL